MATASTFRTLRPERRKKKDSNRNINKHRDKECKNGKVGGVKDNLVMNKAAITGA